jgi:LytS/YehU family sensor histidine kinase
MLDHGKVIGVIASTHAQQDFYTEHYLQLLTIIASQCTDRINKAVAEQEVRRKETQLINLSRNLAISRLKTLQSQMNPHFIFNSLNSIQYFIATNDKQAAMSYLAKFARLVRQILDSSVSGRVKLADELEILTNYISLEQLRLENSFDFTVRVDEKILAENLEIPSLLLQPYVENAILHGLRHLTGRRGKLTVEICKLEAGITCIIEDNGIGRQKAGTLKSPTHQSKATELSQRRLSELVRVTSLYQGSRVNTLDLFDQEGRATGTRVEIMIPIFVDLFSADELVY